MSESDSATSVSVDYSTVRQVLVRIDQRQQLRELARSVASQSGAPADRRPVLYVGEADPPANNDIKCGTTAGYVFFCSNFLNDPFDCSNSNYQCHADSAFETGCGLNNLDPEFTCEVEQGQFECDSEKGYLCMEFDCNSNDYDCSDPDEFECFGKFGCEGTFDCEADNEFNCDTQHGCSGVFQCEAGGAQTETKFDCGTVGGGGDAFGCTDQFHCKKDFSCSDVNQGAFVCGTLGNQDLFNCSGDEFECQTTDSFQCNTTPAHFTCVSSSTYTAPPSGGG